MVKNKGTSKPRDHNNQIQSPLLCPQDPLKTFKNP